MQLAYQRLRGLLPPERIWVCTKADYQADVAAHLPELPPANILGEPEGRDTANAVGLTAAVLAQRDPAAVMAVVTADHIIEPVARFHEAVSLAFDVLLDIPHALVTFGIVPTEPHTGLGYIHRGEPLPISSRRSGAYRVLAFKEKPDKPTAERYLESGHHYWNSGMFVWRADTVLRELALHLPESHKGLQRIAAAWDTPQRQATLAEVYPTLRKISVDFAVMEPAAQNRGRACVLTVEMPVQWMDIGSWPALADVIGLDAQNNAVDAAFHVLVDSDNNIIVSHEPEHLMAAVGVSDMIIVHTRDVTMVCPRRDAQRVKDLVLRTQDTYAQRFQ
jgi:mannose-1-phosphate guanylyltransferase